MPDNEETDDNTPKNNVPDAARSKPVDMKSAILCIVLGILCLAFPFIGSRVEAGLFSKTVYLLSACMAFGLFLTAVGGYASGKWQGWTFGGAAATVVALFLMLLTVGKPGADTPPEKTILATIKGPDIYSKISAVEALQETGERLFVAPNRDLRLANVLMEKSNLDAHCIVFVLVPEKQADQEDGNGEAITVRVPTGYFHSIIAGSTDPARLRLKTELHYHHPSRSFLRKPPAENVPPEPVSMPGNCTDGPQTYLVPERRNIFQSLGLSWSSTAFAADADNQELIDMLVSNDALIRRAAREQIAKRGPDIVPALMNSIAADRGRHAYRAQLGVAISIAKMEKSGFPAKDIRAKIKPNELARLVLLMGHKDKTMRKWATAAIIRLEDNRSVDFLVSKLNVTTSSENGKYNAAYALREIAQKAEQPVQLKITANTRQFRHPIKSKGTKLLLKQLPADDTVAPVTGWVFLGSKFGAKWSEQHFKWSGSDTEMASRDQIITASSDVNMREEHISFSLKGGWKNSDIVGVVRSGDKVKINTVKEVTPGFFWAEVEPVS